MFGDWENGWSFYVVGWGCENRYGSGGFGRNVIFDYVNLLIEELMCELLG